MTRGRGRPSTGVKIQVRIPPDLLAEIDSVAADYGWSRARTIRMIVASWRSDSWLE